MPASGCRGARLTPPAGCGCAGRSPSWLDLLAPFDRPAVVLAGPWAQRAARPAAAGTVLADRGAGHRRRRQPAPGPRPARAGLVRAQGGHRRPGRAAAAGAGQRHPGRPGHHHPPRHSQPAHRRRRAPRRADLPPRRQTGPAGSSPGWHLPLPRLRHPRANAATWTTSSPTRPAPPRRRTCRHSAGPITGSNTTAAGPSP